MSTPETDEPAEVAKQIHILLTGLAQRAERAGLVALAAKLRSVAVEAEQAAKDR